MKYEGDSTIKKEVIARYIQAGKRSQQHRVHGGNGGQL